LTVTFADTALAEYHVNYQPDAKQFRTVDEPKLFEHRYHSPQLPLWELGDDEWFKVVRLPSVIRRKRPQILVEQHALPL
jgi:hypothetical protein